MDFKLHEFSHAIVGKMTPSQLFDKADYNEARRQHRCYLRLLMELNVEVEEVDLGNCFPDNIFMDDVAIICHGIALLLTPSNAAKQAKMQNIKEVLSKNLGQNVFEINDPAVKIHGSDVLFTGHEFFVSICDTTNEAGASVIAATFPEFPCTPIKVQASQHLKKYVTVAGNDILCISASKEGREILKKMEREATFNYHTLTVPEDEAANCLFINGTLVHRAIEEIPLSFKVFCDKIDFARRSICFGQLSKMTAGLSAHCLLVRKP